MSSDTARAFWVVAPGRGEIRTERLPEPGPDDVVVQTLYTGVSRGTEALVFHGAVPASERTRMRAPFQQGDFPGPVKYGYANVGQVEHGPGDLLGRTVFALYPHQTRYVLPSGAVIPVPETVPAARAVLAPSLETAVNGLWDAEPKIGDRIVVIGAGTVGCLVAWLAGRIPGCHVELVDVNPMRASIARTLGVRFALPKNAEHRADLVVHASGSPAGLGLALEVAAFEARVVEMSWYGSHPVAIALGEAFHAGRLDIRSSQVGTVATVQRARWDRRRRLTLALDLLSDPVLDALITDESDFDTLPDTMARLADSPGDTICHRIRYSGP
jgi:2-desacetyl-2-hydroxyethyl bacteriochlorophyllide A dehydrogenase